MSPQRHHHINHLPAFAPSQRFHPIRRITLPKSLRGQQSCPDVVASAFAAPIANRVCLRADSSNDGNTASSSPHTYDGPILTDPNGIIAGFSLSELGLDLAVAPSTIAPGAYGLFAALSPGVESVTAPCMELLCGYSREGTFEVKDEGDKTVGFALVGPETAVFYEKRLMSVLDALEMAAKNRGVDGACGLAGHVLVQDEDSGRIDIFVDVDNCSGEEFKRYYVPSLMNKENGEETLISVSSLGQFCNDLAWSYDDPPKTKEEYDSISLKKNSIQLVWRLEFDEQSNSLVPTWPVSVFAGDTVLKNEDFMELGTKYGWSFWQATTKADWIS